MAFNGVTKSTVKSNKQDYINILYSDSDSDHVPDLKLPPVKGKKQRRKKPLTNLTKEDGGCGAICVFKTILVLLICTTLVIMAGLCIWTLQRVSDLQEQVRVLQNPEQGKNDLSLLQSQVKDIENSLQELKKSDGVLEHMKGTVTEMGVKLRKVEATTAKLNQSVVDAQSLLNTPKNLRSLTDIVASLGSDFKEEQKTRSAKIDELEQRLSVLEAKQLEKAPEVAEKKYSVDAQYRDMLLQQITDVNETSKSGIESVKEQLNLLQGRLSALETYAQSKESGLGYDEVETLVINLIQEKMSNLSSTSGIALSTEVANGSSDEFSQLSAKVSQLTQMMESKYDFAERMDLVSKGGFGLFKGDSELKFQTINQTLFALNTELDSLLRRLDTVDTAVLNISAMMANGREFSDHNGQDVAASPNSNSASTTVSSVKETVTNMDSLPNSSSAPTTPQSAEEVVPKTDPPAAASSEISKEVEQELHQSLEIKGINTADDLHKAYWESWPKNDGQIASDIILSLLKDNSTESARTLETYDSNNDSLFNEEELQKALGLPDTQVPRRSLARLLGPTGLARASGGEGGGRAIAAGQKTVTDADWCSSLMVLPLLPVSPNQCEHSVHVHTPKHSIPASTTRLN
ncbi:EF-hand calcium-binding domain-containing protein 14-like isoform X2 [Elysia marginata]|uniref:EF-hand calcium-binding domain-containing protein 14-like isoform X2 n=1 Tax=Elysia marginata TaxID=1093978 RepID=A0AAV4HDX0_9GAST|nr:EF-hand calcium-binding domain-containing protein 14-like isoform X2 [Elysia marginata]